LEFIFRSSDHLDKVMNKATDLRTQITAAVNDKLAGEDIHDATKDIKRALVRFAHLRIEFS
jgi:hypothetical protein